MSALPLKADIDWSTYFSSMSVENLTEPSFKISTRGAVPRMPMVPTGEDGTAHRNRTCDHVGRSSSGLSPATAVIRSMRHYPGRAGDKNLKRNGRLKAPGFCEAQRAIRAIQTVGQHGRD